MMYRVSCFSLQVANLLPEVAPACEIRFQGREKVDAEAYKQLFGKASQPADLICGAAATTFLRCHTLKPTRLPDAEH